MAAAPCRQLILLLLALLHCAAAPALSPALAAVALRRAPRETVTFCPTPRQLSSRALGGFCTLHSLVLRRDGERGYYFDDQPAALNCARTAAIRKQPLPAASSTAAPVCGGGLEDAPSAVRLHACGAWRGWASSGPSFFALALASAAFTAPRRLLLLLLFLPSVDALTTTYPLYNGWSSIVPGASFFHNSFPCLTHAAQAAPPGVTTPWLRRWTAAPTRTSRATASPARPGSWPPQSALCQAGRRQTTTPPPPAPATTPTTSSAAPARAALPAPPAPAASRTGTASAPTAPSRPATSTSAPAAPPPATPTAAARAWGGRRSRCATAAATR